LKNIVIFYLFIDIDVYIKFIYIDFSYIKLLKSLINIISILCIYKKKIIVDPMFKRGDLERLIISVKQN